MGSRKWSDGHNMRVLKDVYLYISKFTDLKTVINMLSVNKKFNNCYEIVLKNRYPRCAQFKAETESWKEFALDIFYHIFIIENIFDIKLSSNYNVDPRDINWNIFSYINMISCIESDIDAEDYVDINYKTFTNYYHSLKILFDNLQKKFYIILYCAIGMNQYNIIKIMIEMGADKSYFYSLIPEHSVDHFKFYI